MKKLAIIGASELQNPLILRAKEMGCETHVFAWAAGDIGEETADYFYPISIVERDAILAKCREIGIDGICTIASDLANVCVGYVANAMGLSGNTPECVLASTDKHVMRRCFEEHGCPSPKSHAVMKPEVEWAWLADSEQGATADEASTSEIAGLEAEERNAKKAEARKKIDEALEGMRFPVIVKPVDRSGSRGITKLQTAEGVPAALKAAYAESFGDVALIEEFAEGREFSIESCSWRGRHEVLQITEKFTTGAPSFIEVGHLEPARVTPEEAQRIRSVTVGALDALGVQMGAGHAELKMDSDGTIRLIEVGSRMGGDCIGSDLVRLSTGVDFIGAVVSCALGEQPDFAPRAESRTYRNATVKYVLKPEDVEVLDRVSREHPSWIRRQTDIAPFDHAVSDSSTRMGFAVMSFDDDFDATYLGFEEF